MAARPHCFWLHYSLLDFCRCGPHAFLAAQHEALATRKGVGRNKSDESECIYALTMN